ncbi:nucleotidyltransferase-like protein [Halanaerobium saccharolyticum]|uniref:Nucleotidyltransferase-like protein n=1 Tax=Halanaerobium saccharolyticum TaxID=43595 RepID=A0A4R6LAV0_9FIRM|nr:nucleotidyltransferase domain-containing protein [Halanaerobium saccharolyticum]TDO73047.1 nucleotidyltransferase-like protein [Halanaerobium saccharolyticum]
MFKHHAKTIENLKDKINADPEIKAALICGSIAHGYARKNSDVDVLFIISAENYNERKKRGELTYFNQDLAVKPAEYVDGKYIDLNFMKNVSQKGSEPARFAFEGAEIIYSEIDNLEELLEKIIIYPKKEKRDKIVRFYAQFEAWKWYAEEAIKHNNMYLLNRSVNNFVLFGGRLILAENETLYPFHKWFLKVLSELENKPSDLMMIIDQLMSSPDQKSIDQFYQKIKEYKDWPQSELRWPNIFMQDTELSWLDDKTPVADL